MVDVCQRARCIWASLCQGASGQSSVTPLIPPGLELDSPYSSPWTLACLLGLSAILKPDPVLDSPCLCWKLIASSDLSTHEQSCSPGLSSFICGLQMFGFGMSPRGCRWICAGGFGVFIS